MVELVSLIGMVISAYVAVRMGESLLVSSRPGMVVWITQQGLRLMALLVMFMSAMIWLLLVGALFDAPTGPK